MQYSLNAFSQIFSFKGRLVDETASLITCQLNFFEVMIRAEIFFAVDNVGGKIFRKRVKLFKCGRLHEQVVASMEKIYSPRESAKPLL